VAVTSTVSGTSEETMVRVQPVRAAMPMAMATTSPRVITMASSARQER